MQGRTSVITRRGAALDAALAMWVVSVAILFRRAMVIGVRLELA
jgi:hypothetical protein